MDIEHWPVTQASQIAAAYAFSDDKVDVVYAYDDSFAADPGFVSDCTEIWETIAAPFAVSHLVLRFDDEIYVVSGHGKLIFRGRGAINLGLLFRSLNEHDLITPAASTQEPDFIDADDIAIWRVLERIARCETPRRLRFEVGQQEVVCSADASGFQIDAGAADFEEFAEMLRAGARSGKSLRYTLSEGQAPAEPRPIMDVIGALVGWTDDDESNWLVKRGCWPTAVPPTAQFDQLRAVMRLSSCKAVERLSQGGVSLKAYGADRRVHWDGEINTDGAVTMRCYL